MDIDTVEPGADFVESIDRAIDRCEVVIVVIGKGWATIADAAGHRRLEQPMDFVRIEVETSLGRNKHVIPLLVGGATMPSKEELPGSLADLVRRNAFELSDSRWSYDSERLISSLEKILSKGVSSSVQETHAPETPPPLRKSGANKVTKAVIAAAVGFIGSLVTGLLKAGFPFAGRWYYDDFWEFGYWLILWPIFGIILWLLLARMTPPQK
jgi:hypothetical protein